MITISFHRQLCLAFIAVVVCYVTGCRSSRTKPEQNNCDFICFEDVGPVDILNYPFTVCLNDPSPELKDCIGKHLHNSVVNDLGPEFTLLHIVKISPGDFNEVEVSISDFIADAKGQLRGHGESGAVGVTISYRSKVRSKDIGPQDYKLLLNQIPVEVLQRNPELATGLQGMIKDIPLREKMK